MLREKLATFGASFLLHAALVASLAWCAVDQVRGREKPRPMEFELVTRTTPPAPPPIETPAPEPPPIPTTSRPQEVPEEMRVAHVDKAKPLAPDVEVGEREAPDNAEAVPAAATTMVFDMSSDVGGGGGGSDYVTTSTGDGTVAVGAPGHGGDGTGGGAHGAVDRAGASHIAVAHDWQVTVMPEPINDRDFEPDYPPLAKREGREATVVVRLFIDTDGHVARAEVVEGPKGNGFRSAALAYARKLRFHPARAGARVVASRIDWTVSFYVHN